MKDKSEYVNPKEEIGKLLPGYNCGICGYARCDEFAGALLKKHTPLEKCRFLYQELFFENLNQLKDFLKNENVLVDEKPVTGLLDGKQTFIFF